MKDFPLMTVGMSADYEVLIRMGKDFDRFFVGKRYYEGDGSITWIQCEREGLLEEALHGMKVALDMVDFSPELKLVH